MTASGERRAVVLVAHGTVDALDDLPEFITNIRRGHAPPPELLAEVRRRYQAIGGSSPLNTINRDLARRLEARLGLPVRFANRLFRPYPREVLEGLAKEGTERVVVVALAQHSSDIYAAAVRQAAAEAGLSLTIVAAPNWGRAPALTDAFARAIMTTLAEVPEARRPETTLLMTAHSLPVSIIQAGDAYETEFRNSAADVALRVRELSRAAPGSPAKAAPFDDHIIAFQSQGMSTGPGGRPMEWLGPTLRAQLEVIAARGPRGTREVVLAPIGFLADHVEILYDLDIEAQGWADELGLTLRRSPSLNASDGLIEALAGVVEGVAHGAE